MLCLIADVRKRVAKHFGVTMEHEVVLWLA
jgi:UDP-N-acetylenolpyruvoylglucosamine reductase